MTLMMTIVTFDDDDDDVIDNNDDDDDVDDDDDGCDFHVHVDGAGSRMIKTYRKTLRYIIGDSCYLPIPIHTLLHKNSFNFADVN